ncbi:NAD(P)H-binding protein [Arthrobacter sp. I2-34]|uniref:NAD(P)H-binding protein n=1 Tax=Arthrobacter hankyongi TaxID=2904801 RepID=A0ABS9LAD0_9MICC|nr:NAD(P)H-binding protein [Arthrobacter hankyongi]MCG2623644.1 NAD(P)H-binding protein [Arthrobacter hankyongi]
MSIVVTGATGQFGRLVVKDLLKRGVESTEITATGRAVERLRDLADRGVRTAAFDFGAPADGVIRQGDVVLLVSGSEVGQRIGQHRNVVEAAARAGAARIVYTSAPSADETTLILAPEHAATEAIIRGSGLPFTFLRNGWYSENYRPAFDQAKAAGTILGSAHGGRISSAPRADFAAAAGVVLTEEGHKNAVYELGGDAAWTMADLAGMIGDALGRAVTYQDVSADEHRRALQQAGLDEMTIGFLVGLDQNTAENTLLIETGDLSRLIGRPTTPMRETVQSWVS